MKPHDAYTCKVCGPYINTEPFRRGIMKAKQMAEQRDKDINK